ncbi:MAG TPA: AAA family ATPase [Candidatus Fusicatenibacter intestinipullorum]|nr:AAA family ATPase [Candidatus Fusicatenibacter intestinipullorum]
MNSWFFAGKNERGENDIENLWEMFQIALKYVKDKGAYEEKFFKIFDKVKNQKTVKWKITIGLYWIAPFSFLNLDSVNQNFIVNNSEIVNNIEVDGLFKKMINGNEYLQLIKSCEDYFKKENSKYRSFPELSLAAWKYSQNKVNKCWLVGASWGRVNKTDEFIENEIWQNGYDDKYLDEVKHVKVGDKIVIKTTYTMKNNLPFEYNRSASVMDIVAIGTVTKNLKDGKNLEVNWNNKLDEPKKWYFSSWRDTIQEIKRDKSWKEADLLDFIFEGKEQDYNKFLNDKTDEASELSDKIGQEVMELDKNNINPYTKQNFLNEVFMKETDYDKLVALLKHKKNIILQGAPGVGKTFTAKRLAYSLIGTEDDSRIEMVQFHQNYSYEDFVMGYRPTETGFELRNGVFYDFCEKARSDIENDYYFIIDEINRGNLSAVFGELLMLVEGDYRDKPVRLVYKKDKWFSVPHNVYIIGMMNTADRSIAMIDYALRRRFSFFTMKPGFDSEGFVNLQNKVNHLAFNTVINEIKILNNEIAEDDSLGEGFCIGHSYFVYDEKNPPVCGIEMWLKNVIEYDICPMLDEYWFDDKQKADSWQKRLTGIFSK